MSLLGTSARGKIALNGLEVRGTCAKTAKAAPNEGGPKMAVAANTVATMSDDEHRRQLRRALIASTVGTTIEWYDFLLYGTVSALVFGPIFFPQSDPLMGVLQSFGIFFIGFVGRPRLCRAADRGCDFRSLGGSDRP